jgi:2',3'-cyclic-nucleotide 2'-phosphodiesterase/3'-nucleotidase
VLRAARAGHRATLDYMNYPVGRTQAPLHSYFALVRNCAAVQLICQAQARFIAEARTGSTLARLPLLSAAAPFKVGGWGGSENYTDIPAGPLFQRNLADLYCFPNTICALHLRGADIVEWLERSAAAFHRVTPGLTDQPLLDDAFPSYNFDVITGLTYRIDPSQPARYCVAGRLIDGTARRVRDICHQGKPLDMQAEFLVATNNFRASTRAAFCVTPDVAVTCAASTTIRTILLNEVARRPGLDVTLAPNWSFVPMPDTSFIFTSSPKAARYLPDTCPTPIEQCGDDANGFSRYRLWGAPGP